MPSRRSVAMMRHAISPRLAMRTLSMFIVLSHPEDAVAGFALGCAQAHVEREPQDVAGLGRVDDAVVPETRRRVVGAPLLLVLGADRRLELGLVLGAPRAAAGLDLVAADRREDGCRLRSAHDRDAGARPQPQEPR